MRTPMETGEIDLTALKSDLLLGWDGIVLRWMLIDGNEVLDFGEEKEVAGFQPLIDLHADVRSVCVSFLRPVFSLMPSAVASGIEKEVLQVHHGPSNPFRRSFHSERFGEEITLIESGKWEQGDAFLKSWPQVRWTSATLGWLEHQKRRSISAEFTSLLSIDVGTSKALMSRFDEGRLAWCIVAEDVDGDGVLYHAVNSLMRNDFEEGLENGLHRTRVVFSGAIENNRRMIRQFERFFPHVEVDEGGLQWKTEAPAQVGEWNLLSHALR